jgi:hypothetical protein
MTVKKTSQNLNKINAPIGMFVGLMLWLGSVDGATLGVTDGARLSEGMEEGGALGATDGASLGE